MSSSIYSSKILLFGNIVHTKFIRICNTISLYNGRLKLNAANNDKDSIKNLRIHRIFKNKWKESFFGLVENK